jgi:hypothetical protein
LPLRRMVGFLRPVLGFFLGFVFWVLVIRSAGRRGGAAKIVRACGGCLGARRRKGVEDCDKFRGAVKRALIRKYPSQPGELKHLITRRKRKKPRLRQ